MNELTIFSYEGNEVRTVIGKDGEHWFVAKDVCSILEIQNTSDVVSFLKDSEKDSIVLNEGIIGNPNKIIINETGLYLILMRSRKTEAVDFQRWIAEEVLPSIRKTGSYSIKPKTYGEALIEAGRLAIKNEQLLIETAENKPKVEYYDRVANTTTLYSVNDTAKMLGYMGEKKLFKYLRDNMILNKNNLPYQRFIESGYFEIKESLGVLGWTFKTTKVTGKGRQWLSKRLGMLS